MNIAIITSYWPSKRNQISGIFVAQQADAIARSGAKVTVFRDRAIGRFEPELLSMSDLGFPNSRVDIKHYPVLRLPEKLSFIPGFVNFNTRLYGFFIHKYILKVLDIKGPIEGAVVHGLRYGGFSLPFWRKLIKGNIIPVCHGVDPFLIESSSFENCAYLTQKMVKASERVVLVGNALKDHARSLNIPQNRICVVPNGCNLPKPDSVSDSQRPLHSKRRLISVSNLVSLKGIDFNLRALARIQVECPKLDWEYIIIGDGPSREHLRKLSVSLGVFARVRFLGRLPYEETMNQICTADVFSLPSWGEAFGIVYLEAMARVRPVIGCLQNGAEDIITHNKEGLLVNPKDEEALTEALKTLLTDPELCRVMGNLGRQTSKRFSWDANARTLIDLLHS